MLTPKHFISCPLDSSPIKSRLNIYIYIQLFRIKRVQLRVCAALIIYIDKHYLYYQPISNCATWQLPADGRKVARAAAAEEEVVGDREDRELRLVRRQLGGPGSSPPRCTLKCGKCTPCTAVRVLVHPGTPVKAEYYPEAWRCKCGDKLFMP